MTYQYKLIIIKSEVFFNEKICIKVRKSDMINYENHYMEFVSTGEFRSDRPWIHPERIIDTYEIILVLEGTVHIEEDSERYSLTKNEIIILEPGRVHRGFEISNEVVAFYWVHYRSNMPAPFKNYDGANFYEAKLQIKRLLHMANTPAYPLSSSDACMLMIYNELAAIGDKNDFTTRLAHKLAEYIRINLPENPTAVSVARHFGYNPDYLGKIFKKSFNMGLKDYISLQKINKAKNLLVSTDLSVKQISADLGWRDENLFVKFFKYHEDISPTGFRNLYKAVHMNNK